MNYKSIPELNSRIIVLEAQNRQFNRETYIHLTKLTEQDKYIQELKTEISELRIENAFLQEGVFHNS